MTAIVKPAPASPHPLAGTEVTCADIIIRVFAEEGVGTIFGYGGSAILPTNDAIFRYNAAHPRTKRFA
jgi:acetolactate synthase I/II/III large subunit